MDYVNTGGINVVLTPGRYNAAFFEHSYLAERSGAILAMPQDLFVENNHLYYSQYHGKPLEVGCVYRRISDEYLDPLTFLPESRALWMYTAAVMWLWSTHLETGWRMIRESIILFPI